jgi:Flp pilus assembly secretin CpaC
MAIIGTKKRAALFAVALSLAVAAAAPALATTPFHVPLDQARPIVLKAPATGVVIGNPSIAGVTLQSDRLLFVTGKSYGTTNIIVVGEGGRPVYEGLITVTSNDNGAGTVTLTRGLQTIRQSCTPICRKTPDIADDQTEYSNYQSQVTAHATGAKN